MLTAQRLIASAYGVKSERFGLMMPPVVPGTKPRRLLVLANSMWNIANFRRELVIALAEQGWELEVAVPDPPNDPPDLPVTGLHSFRLDRGGLNPLLDAATFKGLFDLMERRRPDAVVGFTMKPNIYGAAAARLLHIPFVPNVSGLGTAFIRGGLLGMLVTTLARVAFGSCPAILFQNPEDRDLFIAKRIATSGQAMLVPGSGIDLVRFAPSALPAADTLNILFVGRLIGDKGLRELASASRILKQNGVRCRVQLLGAMDPENRTAIAKPELEAWIADGLVDYLGEADDVRPSIASADAVILPSYREGLSRSLLEAAAMARPLIASDVPGNRELVRDGDTGILFRVRDPNSLADAIARFAAMSPLDRQQMGQRARRIVETGYTVDRVIDSYATLLDRLVPANR